MEKNNVSHVNKNIPFLKSESPQQSYSKEPPKEYALKYDSYNKKQTKNKQTIKPPKAPQEPKAPTPKIPHPLKNYPPQKNQNLPSPKKIPLEKFPL